MTSPDAPMLWISVAIASRSCDPCHGQTRPCYGYPIPLPHAPVTYAMARRVYAGPLHRLGCLHRSGWQTRRRRPRARTARPRRQTCALSTWPSSWRSSRRWGCFHVDLKHVIAAHACACVVGEGGGMRARTQAVQFMLWRCCLPQHSPSNFQARQGLPTCLPGPTAAPALVIGLRECQGNCSREPAHSPTAHCLRACGPPAANSTMQRTHPLHTDRALAGPQQQTAQCSALTHCTLPGHLQALSSKQHNAAHSPTAH